MPWPCARKLRVLNAAALSWGAAVLNGWFTVILLGSYCSYTQESYSLNSLFQYR